MANSKKTTKKQVVVGTQTYTNEATGMTETFNVIEQRDADFNFEKLWLGHLLESLDVLGNKKVKVMSWILKSRNRENQVIATQRHIAKETGVSLPTVNQTIDSMVEVGAIKQVQRGVLMLNPSLIFKGGYQKRMNVLLKYNQVIESEVTPENEGDSHLQIDIEELT